MATPCVFFDRDGIVNEVPDPARYVVSVERFRLIPAFLEALGVVKGCGYAAVVVTNQRGIALGEMTGEAVEAIHAHLGALVGEAGLVLDGVYVCPFDDDRHPWRKPNPGMLLQAAEDLGLDLAASWMVGDKESDVTTGRRAGCRTIRVGPLAGESAATHRVPDMPALPGLLRRVLAGGGSPPGQDGLF